MLAADIACLRYLIVEIKHHAASELVHLNIINMEKHVYCTLQLNRSGSGQNWFSQS